MQLCQLHFTAILCQISFTVVCRNEIPFREDAHPFLYYSSEDVSGLRAKAETTHKTITKHLKEPVDLLMAHPDWYLPPKEYKAFAKNWNEHFGNNLCSISLYSALFPDDEKLFEMVMEYMDRMASYPDWYVASSHGQDQVPVGHSLTGFATAYDFLYDRVDQEKRRTYYNVIKRTTEDLHNLLTKRRFGWTREYVHNHAPSNIVALLLGALVVSAHEPNLSSSWIKQSREHLDFAMELFSYVTDGSVDEGVSYGTYTSRGLTQFVFLSLRHFNTDHTTNPWLKEHFWFLYKTVLPGYQRAAGIADSNHNWFYGPESHLVMLDAYVMKNGYGNWLADRIRESRTYEKPLVASSAQIWSTRHTEFIFYNPSLQPRKPVENPDKKLHCFPDWGVATYGGGQEMKTGNTFLSFKSSALNGDAMREILFGGRYPELITGWGNLNPGHEHPDQNSFTFAPNGRYFVTESLYGPKFTWLNNAIVFSPSSTSSCNQPWEGQLGECDKWMRFKLYTPGRRAEIVAASSSKDMVFIAGEAAEVYSKSLQLQSVYRGVLLLNPEVLVVADTIRLRPGSKTRKASAFFHNVWKEFETYDVLGYPGAKVQYPEGDYTVFTMASGQLGKVAISLHNNVQPAGLREGPTNYINATFDLPQGITNVVHVFSGPNYKINSAVLQSGTETSGVSLSLDINGQQYKIGIASAVKSTTRMFDPIRERRRVTGFNGFAKVHVGSETHFFGLDKSAFGTEGTLGSLTNEQLQALRDYHVNPTKSKNDSVIKQFSLTLSRPARAEWMSSYFLHFNNIASIFTLSVMLIFTFRDADRKQLWTKRLRGSKMLLATIFLLCLTIENTICINSQGKNTCFGSKQVWRDKNHEFYTEPTEMTRSEAREEKSKPPTIPKSPFVLLTSLPGAGGDLLENVFTESNMTIYLPSREVPFLKEGHFMQPDLCHWDVDKSESHLDVMGWLASLKKKPLLYFNQFMSNHATETIRHSLRNTMNAPMVLNDLAGFWMTKLPWLRHIVGVEDLQPVVIVRDPRSWVHMLLNQDSDSRKEKVLDELVRSFDVALESCSRHDTKLPLSYYLILKSIQDRGNKMEDPVEKLATVWAVTTGGVLANEAVKEGQWPLQVVKYEDVVENPETSVTNMFYKLGLPLGFRSLSKISRVVKSGRYDIPLDGIFNKATLKQWTTELSEKDTRKIENICCDVMKVVGYECTEK